MTTADIIKITDECKLCGVGYNLDETVSYRITQFDNGWGYVETIDGIRKEYETPTSSAAETVMALNEHLNILHPSERV